MAMQTDVKSTHLTSSGTIFNGRARLKSSSFRGNGGDGFVKFRDGGSNGTIFCEIDVGTNDIFTIYVLLPGEGIVFPTSIYAEMSNVSAITTFYG